MLVMGLIMIIPIISADTWFDQNSSLSITANLFIEDYPELMNNTAALNELLVSFTKTGL
jgi:hypothetical protein